MLFLTFFFLRGVRGNAGWFSINIAGPHSQLYENIFSSCNLQWMAVNAGWRVGMKQYFAGSVMVLCNEIFSALAQWWKKWLFRAKGFLKSPTIYQILFTVQNTAAKESTDKERHNTLLLIINTPGSQEIADHRN